MSSPGPIKLLRTIPTFSDNTTDVTITGAPLDSPAFTGTPTAPTPAAGDDSTRIATTDFVDTAIDATIPATTVGALTKLSAAHVLSTTNLTGDVTTSNTPACTVAKIQSIPVTTTAPLEGDVLRYSVTDGKYMEDVKWDWYIRSLGVGGMETHFNRISNLADSSGWSTSAGTVAVVNPTATEMLGTKLTTAAVNPSSSMWCVNTTANIFWSLGTVRRVKFRIRLVQTTTTRIWIGLGVLATSSAATFRADAPNTNFIGFRYSTPAGDTKYQCVTQTDNTHQTINAETTSTHVDTNTHNFELTWDGTNITFYIDGTQVGQQSGNLPATATLMTPMIAIDNAATANGVAFETYYVKGCYPLI